ncbi:MAG: response regulator [Pseudobacteriovorax sp.]|nr:response regulator [Pseudobacteriovorax sp.]
MNSSQKPSKVLIIDNDEATANRINSILMNHQIPGEKAINYSRALYFFNQQKIDLCIIEKEIDDIPATVLIQKFRDHEVPSKRNPAFIVVSSSAADRDLSAYKEIGGIVVIAKPIKEPVLLSAIVRAKENAMARAKLFELEINVLNPLIEKGDMEQAVNIAETNLMPGGNKAKFLASEINEKAENYERSTEVTGALHKGDEKNLQYINQLGRLHLKTKDLKKAAAYFEKADKQAPDHIERMEAMAGLYLEMRLPDKSIEKYRKLIKFNPERPDLKFEFFEELQKRGFDKEAVKFCQENTKALELIRHYNNRGVMMSKEEKYIDAIDEYAKAAKLIPNSKELYRILYNSALAHINLKKHAHLTEASRLLKEALKLKPDFTKAQEKLVIVEGYLSKSA